MAARTAYGVALCRFNKHKQVEILMIKKRYTYSFFMFVYGFFRKSDTKQLKHLFDTMTFQEKIDIMSMQFHLMWYRIALNNPDLDYNINDMYELNKIKTVDVISRSETRRIFRQKREKFMKNFKHDDDTRRLFNLISQSTDSELLWEVPKGSRCKGETDLTCAMREFREESSIDMHYYDIIDSEPAIETHEDNGVTYRNVYYVAELKRKYAAYVPRVHYTNPDQTIEIEQIKWVSLDAVRHMNLNEKLTARMRRLFKFLAKKFIKNSSAGIEFI
jgi:8-oxo-dGTP pyrophosphatase MutT (NUDIX family)